MERYLFLDIDGVLADYEYIINSRLDKGVPYEETLVDSKKVKLLNELKDLNVKVVISSSWGNWENKTEDLLHRLGLELEVIGQTTHLHLQYNWACRGNEIEKWIYDNTTYGDTFKYAILDDDCDMLLKQKDCFVMVDREKALTLKDIGKLRKILE